MLMVCALTDKQKTVANNLPDDRDIGRARVRASDGRGQIAGKACQDEADDQNGQAHQGGQPQSADDKQDHCRQLR
jgi:hypothetical protein